MKPDYCSYPPRLADDVEVTEEPDGQRPGYVVASAAAGRYILLRATEYRVLQLVGESRPPVKICDEFKLRYGATLRLATLKQFLAKLDDLAMLAGERAHSYGASGQQSSVQHYLRFKLFNPDRTFSRLVRLLRWVWTPGFVVFTLLMMLLALLFSLTNWAAITSYAGYVLREHYIAVFAAGTFVAVSHEFAHGLTCKAFGRAQSQASKQGY